MSQRKIYRQGDVVLEEADRNCEFQSRLEKYDELVSSYLEIAGETVYIVIIMYHIERPNYIHVEFGKPYTRSFHVTLCTEFTSTCIKRSYYYRYTIATNIASNVFDSIFRIM